MLLTVGAVIIIPAYSIDLSDGVSVSTRILEHEACFFV